MNLFKGALFVVALCAAVVLVVGLTRAANNKTSVYSVRVYVDHETKCQYVRAGAGVTPRMGSDGKQICGEKP